LGYVGFYTGFVKYFPSFRAFDLYLAVPPKVIGIMTLLVPMMKRGSEQFYNLPKVT
jgi:hypothetical protein